MAAITRLWPHGAVGHVYTLTPPVVEPEDPACFIVNQNFNTDTANWVAVLTPPSQIQWIAPGRMRVISLGDGNAFGGQLMIGAFTVGLTYRLRFDGYQGTAPTWGYVLINSDESIAYIDLSFTGDQFVSVNFVATDTTMGLLLGHATTVNGHNSAFDHVCVDLPAGAARHDRRFMSNLGRMMSTH